MKLSWKNFKKRKFMINCKTQEEANELCQMMHDRGISGYACWWNDYQEDTCYAYNHIYARVSYYESEGYKVVTFQEFKKHHDHKNDEPTSNVTWCTDGSLPDKSGDYLVITDGGGLTVLTYSRVHRLFNVTDTFSSEIANKYAIEVKAWISFDKLNVPEHLLVP